MAPINLSLGSFNRTSCLEAMKLSDGLADDYFGGIAKEHVQICPQNRGLVDPEIIAVLTQTYPDTQFRLHANVQVLKQRMFTNLSTIDEHQHYWDQLIEVNRALGLPVYSAHAGLRKECSLNQVFDNTRKLQDMMGSPVAIEGHYPTAGNPYLISSWSEYARLLNEDVYYALDLSHINIVAHQSKRYEKSLVQDLVSNERCLEVHVSGNDGVSDSHISLKDDPIWNNELQHANPKATIFIESTYSTKKSLTLGN